MATIERLSFSSIEHTPDPETLRIHVERYQYAAQFVSGKVVLDIACGVGYGSKILVDAGAALVVGVDISEDAIEEARQTFGCERLHFIRADYRELHGALETLEVLSTQTPFDVVVSLETIEHIPDPFDFLTQTTNYLKNGGIHIGSVPVTPSMDANPYHLHDFSPQSFRRLLSSHGLNYKSHLRQHQPYNPFTVRKEMAARGRQDIRRNLIGYYMKHPSKALLRIWSSFRYGFCNIYDTIASTKD